MRKASRFFAAIAALFVLSIAALAAQDRTGTDTTVPSMPYPTRLRAAMRNGKVELGWMDATGAPGGVEIYRHVERITSDTFLTATKIGSVGMGVQAFIDTPPDESLYYYAVLALSGEGNAYTAFVASSNVTAAPISLKPAVTEPLTISSASDQKTTSAEPTKAVASPAKPAAAPTKTPATTASSTPPGASKPVVLAPEVKTPVSTPSADAIPRKSGPIESISAHAKDDSIVISYTGGAGLRLVVYRGPTPIERSSDLLDASLVATFSDKDGKFVDYPVPGIDYWYAVLIENDLKAGRIDLVKGKNATAAAAGVALTKRNAAVAETSPTSRTLPLPAFLLDAATGVQVPSGPGDSTTPVVLAPESEKAVASILAKAPPVKRPLPSLKILSEERSAPSGGEDYALSLIVSQKLVRGDWPTSADQLRKYLSLNRSEKAAARAHFYLGEALAFSGLYRDAFFEFLSARSHYPIESAPWIEYVLSALR